MQNSSSPDSLGSNASGLPKFHSWPAHGSRKWVVILMVAVAMLAGVAVSHPVFATGGPVARFATAPLPVSAQGLFRTPMGEALSPGGLYRMEVSISAARYNRLVAEIKVIGAGEPASASRTAPSLAGPWTLHAIPGPAYFISDVGRVAALETFLPPQIPGTLRIYDLTGHEIHEEVLPGATDPCLSPDGMRFLCRTRDGVVDLNLSNFEKRLYPRYALFAAGPDNAVAGVMVGGPLEVSIPGLATRVVALDAQPLRLAFAADGPAVLVLEAGRLLQIDPSTAEQTIVYSAAAGEELRDLQVTPVAFRLGVRHVAGDRSEGSTVAIARNRGEVAREAGPVLVVPNADFSAPPESALSKSQAQWREKDKQTGPTPPYIPWPLQPNAQHPIGNTWAEFQNYGGGPSESYPHPGIDVFGSAGQHVYSVRSGQVKAVLTTGGDIYWRVAIADTVGSDSLPGYLYAHLVQSSITVTPGQMVTAGQYIGDLVDWPVQGFTHTHFARVSESGPLWPDGLWMAIANPNIHLQYQTETTAPVFQTAIGSDQFAFCVNNTSTYLSSKAIKGGVDIIAHVGDTIVSSYVCSVQEIRYWIYPVGFPGYPIVNNKLAVYYNMPIDYYTGGNDYVTLDNILYKQDSVCNTQGDYTNREFYQIITNSDGDQSYGPEDIAQCWDTSKLPDASYVIKVQAWDARGNTAVDSMTVTTANGNPTGIVTGPLSPALTLTSRPNPARGSSTIIFKLPAPGRADLGIYDANGRRIRSLLDGFFSSGPQSAVWDGRNENGAAVPSGIYFYRLDGQDGQRTGRLVLQK